MLSLHAVRTSRPRFFRVGTLLSALLLGILPATIGQASTNPSAASLEKFLNGLTVHLAEGDLRLEVLSPSMIHVAFAHEPSFFHHLSLIRVPPPQTAVAFHVEESATAWTLITESLRVTVDRANGTLNFADASGRVVLAETAGSRELIPAEVQGEHTFHIRQQWHGTLDESLHGLGQMQLGVVDIKGYDLDLWQHNTNIVVPFLVSSKGYGILWDNTSYTRFGDLRPFASIPAANLLDANGTPGAVTIQPADGKSAYRTASISLHREQSEEEKNHPEQASNLKTGQSWVGSIVAPSTGEYQFQSYSNGGIRVWLDGKLVMEHWRQNWLTGIDQVKLHLNQGQKIALRIETGPEQQSTIDFRWKTPPPSTNTSLWSEVGDGIDYTFVYGPSVEQVIAGYRMLTGKAPIPPNWAFGLWQSYQRYETAQQSLDVVNEFRSRKIPFDNIVQDWQYWHVDSWGSHTFDPERFPDPDAWIKAIHDQHAHLMLSVWGKFNPNTDNAKEMQEHGFLYQPNLRENVLDWLNQPYTFYDAFNPEARKLFWQQIDKHLFSKGVDAWWMDATEPDLLPSPPTLDGQRTHLEPTYLGTGSRMLNGYALENSHGVSEGQLSSAPNQRVFILTRSGFAGIQRYSTAIWSGDITSTWTAMGKQIAAGIGASISGLPFWTMDTGGYTMQNRFSKEPMTASDEQEWRELNTRWFQFSTFTPFLRVHGELRRREIWTLGVGSPAYNAELAFDRLRYALNPYIYSLAGAAWLNDRTMLRPLVMDFASDKTAREATDEYMFGPALLVAPVMHYRQREREVYLPPAATWYDYWTGKPVGSGPTKAAAPFEHIPVFVRAGSIIPYGPDLQYVGEKPADPLTISVYKGANGEFTLYEDQGTTNDYLKGAYSLIPFFWNDAKNTLTIGACKGTFSGMLAHRNFRIVLVSSDHAAEFPFTTEQPKMVEYSGAEVQIQLK